MRTITFNVKQQKIKPTSSVSHVYRGTDNYLKLEFAFDENWKDCVLGIAFTYKTPGKEEYAMLLKDNSCIVPKEAFDEARLTFYLVGKRIKYRIQSEQFVIRLGG